MPNEWSDLHRDEQILLALIAYHDVAVVPSDEGMTPRLDQLAHAGLIDLEHEEKGTTTAPWRVRSTWAGRKLYLSSLEDERFVHALHWCSTVGRQTGMCTAERWDEWQAELLRRAGVVN